ncbi:MAG: 50S ribosomal protein L21e [Archaeoglobaceae archaeon]|nr:50S ribosomal protein L21e [Archaeoglobaceae archaeon]MDW7989606.1 50S ribosomal protein L21e [Archaeoglobaceae archaeon]
MSWKSHGFRFKSGRKLKKKVRERGIKIRKFLKEFNIGQKVIVDIESASQKGMPHPRYQGKNGVVIGKRGRAYLVQVKDGSKFKTLISRPEHLKAI